MKAISTILRAIFGAVFIFSGFVKAVDPWGTAYKIEDYLSAFSMSGLVDIMPWLPVVASVILCSIEFMIGVLMFFGFYRKPIKILAAVTMAFFTMLTLVDAITNRVDDCGCFGDAIKLTNWETFWKNVVLDVILVLIFLCERKINFVRSKVNSNLLSPIFALLILSFAIYSSIYEPVIDFRAWKIGNQMVPVGEDVTPPESFASYKNNASGQIKEFNTEDLMKEFEKNPSFASEWTFVDSRVVNTNTVAADGFSLQALGFDEDETFDIISDTSSALFMITTYDVTKASDKGVKRVVEFANKALENAQRVILVTASSEENCTTFIEKYDISNILIYTSDDKSIKTILRSNPGVIKIVKGKVENKWSWRNLPSSEEYFTAEKE